MCGHVTSGHSEQTDTASGVASERIVTALWIYLDYSDVLNGDDRSICFRGMFATLSGTMLWQNWEGLYIRNGAWVGLSPKSAGLFGDVDLRLPRVTPAVTPNYSVSCQWEWAITRKPSLQGVVLWRLLSSVLKNAERSVLSAPVFYSQK